MIEIRDITAANLPDAARLCLAGKTFDDRPRAFTREVELDSTRCKLSALHDAMRGGARAHAAYRDGMLVGYVEYHPIEKALVPVVGDGFHVISCLRVPEPQERIEVEAALVDHACATAKAKGSRGMAITAREKEWTGLGFTDAVRDAAEVTGFERVLWWRPLADGPAPDFAPIDRKLPKIPGKVRVDVFHADRCPWDRYVFDLVRGVAGRMKNNVVLYETDCNKRREVVRTGVTCAIAVDGQYKPWVRPYKLADEHTIKRTIESAL